MEQNHSDTPWIKLHNISDAEVPFLQKETALRVVVGVTCFCSIVGALVIILSYYLDAEIRTKARHILVHLSVADFGVALSNLIGVVVYFDQYIRECDEVSLPVSCKVLRGLCKTQAFVAGYSTLASVLWTQILAVYIYCLVVLPHSKICLKVVYFAYFFCWGMPLLVCAWLMWKDRLGYSPHGGEGWCSLKVHDRNNKLNTFSIVFANDLWIYLTAVVVTVLYLSTHCYLRSKLHPSQMLQGSSAVHKADTKFLLIPCCFLLLRMWTQILIILIVYARQTLQPGLSRFLLYASGIGDSGQGIINAFLFCILTPKVRQKLFSCVVYTVCCICLYKSCCICLYKSCCIKQLRVCCPHQDGYSTIHSLATVDLDKDHSVSVGSPIVQPKQNGYSSCTVSRSVTSASSVDAELSHVMYQ